MMYSDITNLTGIVQDIDFRCSTNANQYPLADKARNINNIYDRIISFHNRTSKKIKWADTSLTAPYNFIDYDVVSGVSNVTITKPNRFQTAEIKDNNGNWKELKLISRDEIKVAIQEFEKTDGIPKYFTIDGDNATLYPASNYSQVGSFRVYDQPETTLFFSTETTKEPEMPRFATVLLSIGASLNYCNLYKKERVEALLIEENKVFEEFKDWIYARDKERSRMIGLRVSSK